MRANDNLPEYPYQDGGLQDGYLTPDAEYFENLARRATAAPQHRRRPPLRTAWLYAAAACLLLLLYFGRPASEPVSTDLLLEDIPVEDIDAYLMENLDEFEAEELLVDLN